MQEFTEVVGSDEAKSGNDTVTIPAITIKENKQKEYDRKKFLDSQKVLPLQIRDILSSRIFSEKPTMFTICNTIYRLTEIVGTIINIKPTKEKKLTLLVDDGSGTISCILNNSESNIKARNDLDNLHNRVSQLETMVKTDLNKFVEMTDELYLQHSDDTQGTIMTTCTKVFIDRIKKNLCDFPLTNDVKIGDNVMISGTVADYQNQRLVFVNHVKKISDMSSYKYYLGEIISLRESMSKKGKK